MKFFVGLILTMACSLSFAADLSVPFKGFVNVAPGRDLYVDYVPATAGQPTVILLNGLTYSTVQWDPFVKALRTKGVGVFRYDMYGMGQTLLKYAPMTDVILPQNQITDLKALLTNFGMAAPYNIAGLSYGGGIAAGYAALYPEDIQNLIMMSPFTEPLSSQVNMINQEIASTRLMFPYNPASDDELYDYFLKQIVYMTYPSAEPNVVDNPYILEAVFRMAQGMRNFIPLKSAASLRVKALHLMVADKDQYIPQAVFDTYWNAVPVTSRASEIHIADSEHKMDQAVPNFASDWVYQILVGNPALFQGQSFLGSPFSGVVQNASGQSLFRLGHD